MAQAVHFTPHPRPVTFDAVERVAEDRSLYSEPRCKRFDDAKPLAERLSLFGEDRSSLADRLEERRADVR
jgi:hypothetical protein